MSYGFCRANTFLTTILSPAHPEPAHVITLGLNFSCVAVQLEGLYKTKWTISNQFHSDYWEGRGEGRYVEWNRMEKEKIKWKYLHFLHPNNNNG